MHRRLEKYIFIKKICSYSINPSMEREYAYSPPPPSKLLIIGLVWFGNPNNVDSHSGPLCIISFLLFPEYMLSIHIYYI